MPEAKSHAELERRLRQQQLLCEFGIKALRARDPETLEQAACEICAEGMETAFAKILKPVENGNELLVVAGVGWRPGVVGNALIGGDIGSPAGFALKTGEPVISNHLQGEARFRTPTLLAEHGIKRAVNVLIKARGSAYGVLEVDSRHEGQFEKADFAFMTGFANLIGVAIERHDIEGNLAEAYKHQELLTREASHRVKNSLATVSAMIALQHGKSEDPDVKSALVDVQARINAIAEAHDQLWCHPTIGMVALQNFLQGIIEKLRQQADLHQIEFECVELDLTADRAIPIGLLVTELVTNAIKHAYPEGHGMVSVGVIIKDDRLLLTVSDQGVGLPEGTMLTDTASQSLGARMIASLARQLDGALTVQNGRGTIVSIEMPIEGAQD